MAPNGSLDEIEKNVKALESSSLPTLVSAPHLPRTVDALAAMRTDPAIVQFLRQADLDLEQIDRIQESLRISRLRIHLQQARMKTALSPVNLLPAEVLSMIFREVSPPLAKESEPDYQSILSLSHVSSLWRSISLEQSDLWNTINVAWSTDQQTNWLKRAAKKPLNIVWDPSPPSNHNTSASHPIHPRHASQDIHPSSKTQGPCESIWQVSSRWQSIHIHTLPAPSLRRFMRKLGSQVDLTLLHTLSILACSMDTIQLQGYGYSYGSDPASAKFLLALNKFTSPLPALRALTLQRIPVFPQTPNYTTGPLPGYGMSIEDHTWCLNIFQSLRYLKVEGLDGRDWLHMLCIGNRELQLEELVIDGGSIAYSFSVPYMLDDGPNDPTTSPYSSSPPPLPIPNITHLTLKNTTESTLLYFAYAIRMPKLEVMYLDLDYTHSIKSQAQELARTGRETRTLRASIIALEVIFSKCSTITTLTIAREFWVSHILLVLQSQSSSTSPRPTSSSSPRTLLLPNLRSLKLNTHWRAKIRDFISYRDSVRHSESIRTSGLDLEAGASNALRDVFGGRGGRTGSRADRTKVLGTTTTINGYWFGLSELTLPLPTSGGEKSERPPLLLSPPIFNTATSTSSGLSSSSPIPLTGVEKAKLYAARTLNERGQDKESEIYVLDKLYMTDAPEEESIADLWLREFVREVICEKMNG